MKYNKTDDIKSIKTDLRLSLGMMDKEQVEELIVDLAMKHRYSRTYILKAVDYINYKGIK
jgi:hypothetical protein|tara:strand:- start:14 stop:193 length:180 start_codon:yes stop_codon:yes gene_type:complete